MTTTITPSLGHGVMMTQAGVGTTPGYDAIDVRRMALADHGEGVQTYESFRVRQRGAGANMSVDIGMDIEAYVRGDAVTLQGLYTVAPHSATINEAVTASDPTNPRLDQVVLELKDNTHDASGSNLAQTRVVAGTPTAGATLDNRNGAAAMPASAILLADVLVPALATTVVDANIRDRRPFLAGVPPLLTRVDMVGLIPAVGQVIAAGNSFGSASDLLQAAALMIVPRRIVAATRLRWKYRQDPTTAQVGNYVLGIYDASGRKIVDTGSVAVTGAAASYQTRSETITATTFEAGLYYLMFGLDYTSGGSILYNGVQIVNAAGSAGIGIPNVQLRSASGGITAPATLLGYTDFSGVTTDQTNLAVPQAALSVG